MVLHDTNVIKKTDAVLRRLYTICLNCLSHTELDGLRRPDQLLVRVFTTVYIFNRWHSRVFASMGEAEKELLESVVSLIKCFETIVVGLTKATKAEFPILINKFFSKFFSWKRLDDPRLIRSIKLTLLDLYKVNFGPLLSV